MESLYAPSARVVAQGCEWIVHCADPFDGGSYILNVDGLHELVSGKSAQFLTQLEEAAVSIRVLGPAKIRLEQGMSLRIDTLKLVAAKPTAEIDLNSLFGSVIRVVALH